MLSTHVLPPPWVYPPPQRENFSCGGGGRGGRGGMIIVTITLENDEQEGPQRTSASELDIHCKRVPGANDKEGGQPGSPEF